MSEVYLTQAGYEKLTTNLERLKTEERRKIAKALEQARLLGDLKENAEYHAAKDEQAHNEARIAELESTLSNVRIIENENIPGDKIYIGAIVTLKDLDQGKEENFQLVSPEESDYDAGKISITSPIGKGLLGKAEGEEAEIEAPAGKLNYKILKIKRP